MSTRTQTAATNRANILALRNQGRTVFEIADALALAPGYVRVVLRRNPQTAPA